LNTPYAICLDAANNLYITDNANERIRKVDTLGNISTIVGTGASGHSGDGGPATAATIYNTGGITFDAAGNMLIADFGNNAIRKVAFGIISTGIPEMTKQVSDYSIFPNPTTNSITIISSEIITTVEILNLSGQMINANRYNANKVQIDIAELPAGTYVFRINGSGVRKFIRQ